MVPLAAIVRGPKEVSLRSVHCDQRTVGFFGPTALVRLACDEHRWYVGHGAPGW